MKDTQISPTRKGDPQPGDGSGDGRLVWRRVYPGVYELVGTHWAVAKTTDRAPGGWSTRWVIWQGHHRYSVAPAVNDTLAAAKAWVERMVAEVAA